MPIILKNGHAHHFSYVDDNGATHDVVVKNGDDIEPLGLPPRVITKLMGDTVISWNGETQLPRYAYVAQAPDSSQTYSSGIVTTQRQTDQLSEQPATPEKRFTQQDLERLQKEAEQEAFVEAQRVEDQKAAAVAEAQQIEREENEGGLSHVATQTVTVSADTIKAAERAELKDIAAGLQVEHQGNIPTEKLRELLLEKTG